MTRAALAVVAGLLAATALYAVTRAVQAALLPEPDPALVFYSEHAGFFWRSLVVGYAGGMAAFVAWIFAGRDEARVARSLARAVVPVALVLVAQALFFP